MTFVRPTFAALLGLGALALGACAMPSDHHAADMRGGYSETQVDRNAFRVTYKGNVSQSQGETNDLALLRSAEVAQSHGYAFFTSGGLISNGSALALFSGAVAVPSTTLTIFCYAFKPDTPAMVYDADQVIATLGPRYGRL